jgi:Phosphotransferase enzyme family
MSTTFPSSVAEMSPEWMTEILRNAGCLAKGHVTSVESVALGGGAGLMSHMSRLVLVYDNDTPGAPSSMIAKLPPDDAGSRRRGVELGFFAGEAGFYGVLGARSPIRTPRYYFVEFDAETGEFLILLEDLSAARLGDQTAGCTEQEAETAVAMLARLHAAWWNDVSLAGHEWLRKLTGRQEELFPLVPEAWPTFVTRFREALDPAHLEILTEVKESLRGSHQAHVSSIETLLHGDFKLDNLFFLPSGEIVVCDWGMAMTGPAMFDIAHFLPLSLPVADRRRLELGLIRTYVKTLVGAGVMQYDEDQALKDYRAQLVGLLPRLIVAGGLAEFADQRSLDEYALGLRRVVSAAGDHGGLENAPWS